MNFRLRLRQQFLWSGQQAIEKYLKAILLYNGKSARYIDPSAKNKIEFRHDLDALHREVSKLPSIGYRVVGENERFLSYLSRFGAGNRYLSRSSYNTSDALPRLDRLVWTVRRYCQYIPDRGIGLKSSVAGMRDAVIRQINNPQFDERPIDFSLFHGELEDILRRDLRDITRQALVWANMWYGSRQRSKIKYHSFNSSEIPPNESRRMGIDLKRLAEFVKP
jgi:hypothetical protein